MLSSIIAAARRPAEASAAATRRESATQLVSMLFYEPALAELRKSPFGTKFGSGGRGEEVFGEQLDKQLALRIAGQDQSGMAKAIAAKLDKPQPANAGGNAWFGLLPSTGILK